MSNIEGRNSIGFIKNRLKAKQGMTEEKEDKTYDLEERLIDFTIRINRMAESLPKTASSQ